MADWKDILSDKQEKLSDEQILRYLDGNISEEEKNELEKATGSFESDAVAGLQQIKDKKKIERDVRQLNEALPHLLRYRNSRKQRKGVKDIQWIVLAIIILLFLCIVTYVLLRMNNHSIL